MGVSNDLIDSGRRSHDEWRHTTGDYGRRRTNWEPTGSSK